jgi:hypothetical protein
MHFLVFWFGPEVVGFGCSSSGEASASTDIVFEGESYEIKLEFSSLLVDFYKLYLTMQNGIGRY